MPSRRAMESQSRRKEGDEGGGVPSPAPASSSSSRYSPARRAERMRRLLARVDGRVRLPAELLVRMTYASFALEQLSVSEGEVAAAVMARAKRRSFRPPQALRIRNHVAILRTIERMNRRREELKVESVVRWYTSLSCGLSTAGIDGARLGRLERHLRRINSPQMRLEPAVGEVAGLHVELLSDPIFPGFNGIVARLLMQYHLARCGLPPVVMDPNGDRVKMMGVGTLEGRVMEMLVESYESLLGMGNGSNGSSRIRTDDQGLMRPLL